MSCSDLFLSFTLNQKCMYAHSNRLLLSIGMTKAILPSSSFLTTTSPDYGQNVEEKTRINKCTYIQSEYGPNGIFNCKYSNNDSGNYLKDSRYSENAPLLHGKNRKVWSRSSFVQQTTHPSLLLTL